MTLLYTHVTHTSTRTKYILYSTRHRETLLFYFFPFESSTMGGTVKPIIILCQGTGHRAELDIFFIYIYAPDDVLYMN